MSGMVSLPIFNRASVGIPDRVIDWFLVLFLALISRIIIFPNLNSVAWGIVDLIAILVFLSSTRHHINVLRANLLLLAWPGLAILSSLWSINFDVTFYHSIQFGMNCFVAFIFARLLGIERFLWVLFQFGIVFLTASLIFGLTSPGLTMDDAGKFRGIYLHKNELGMFSTIQLLLSALFFLDGRQRILCVLSFCVSGTTLLMSGSGTSLLLSLLVLVLIPVVLVLRRGLFETGQVVGGGLFSLALVLLGFVVTSFDLVDYVLTALGKDAGLTGRDLIWKIGIDAVETRPFLGHGFLAYWTSGESTASYLRYVLKQDLVAFHNVYLEVTVAFGIVGLCLFLAGLMQQYFRCFVFMVRHRSILAIAPFLFLVWITFMSLSENPFFWNSQLNFIFMVFAASASMGGKQAFEGLLGRASGRGR